MMIQQRRRHRRERPKNLWQTKRNGVGCQNLTILAYVIDERHCPLKKWGEESSKDQIRSIEDYECSRVSESEPLFKTFTRAEPKSEPTIFRNTLLPFLRPLGAHSSMAPLFRMRREGEGSRGGSMSKVTKFFVET